MKDDLPLVEEFGSSDASAPPSLAMEVGLQSITTQEQVICSTRLICCSCRMLWDVGPVLATGTLIGCCHNRVHCCYWWRRRGCRNRRWIWPICFFFYRWMAKLSSSTHSEIFVLKLSIEWLRVIALRWFPTCICDISLYGLCKICD